MPKFYSQANVRSNVLGATVHIATPLFGFFKTSVFALSL